MKMNLMLKRRKLTMRRRRKKKEKQSLGDALAKRKCMFQTGY